MKCPKCGYLGFEHVDRCRNCGYDFSLTARSPTPDLPMRPRTVRSEPLDDLAFDAALSGTQPSADTAPDLEQVLGIPVEPPRSRPAHEMRRKPDAGALPLFGSSISDDEPLITRPSPPRPPLAVRRGTPELTRVRAAQLRTAPLDLSLDLEHTASPHPRADARPGGRDVSWTRGEDDEAAPRGLAEEDAPLAARFVAVVIDLLVLAVIDAIVIYFTMQICGLTLGEIGMLPKTPLLAFLFAQNVGYLVAFTAGGQTLGKMAAGIRVVPAHSGSTVDLGHALLRTLMWLVLAVPAGLGFLTALFRRDRRGLHDRVAGTRVVRF
jgi:uncharacterized RDD family membrane protein YckC